MKLFYNLITFFAALVILLGAGWHVYSHKDVLTKCPCCNHCACGKVDCKGKVDGKCCDGCSCTEKGCCKKACPCCSHCKCGKADCKGKVDGKCCDGCGCGEAGCCK